MSFCGNCGAQVKSSEKFCRKCGHPYKLESFEESEGSKGSKSSKEPLEVEFVKMSGDFGKASPFGGPGAHAKAPKSGRKRSGKKIAAIGAAAAVVVAIGMGATAATALSGCAPQTTSANTETQVQQDQAENQNESQGVQEASNSSVKTDEKTLSGTEVWVPDEDFANISNAADGKYLLAKDLTDYVIVGNPAGDNILVGWVTGTYDSSYKRVNDVQYHIGVMNIESQEVRELTECMPSTTDDFCVQSYQSDDYPWMITAIINDSEKDTFFLDSNGKIQRKISVPGEYEDAGLVFTHSEFETNGDVTLTDANGKVLMHATSDSYYSMSNGVIKVGSIVYTLDGKALNDASHDPDNWFVPLGPGSTYTEFSGKSYYNTTGVYLIDSNFQVIDGFGNVLASTADLGLPENSQKIDPNIIASTSRSTAPCLVYYRTTDRTSFEYDALTGLYNFKEKAWTLRLAASSERDDLGTQFGSGYYSGKIGFANTSDDAYVREYSSTGGTTKSIEKISGSLAGDALYTENGDALYMVTSKNAVYSIFLRIHEGTCEQEKMKYYDSDLSSLSNGDLTGGCYGAAENLFKESAAS